MQKKILGVAVAALLAFGSTLGHAEPLKIRVGWIVIPATWAPLLFEHTELLKHYGTSYTVEPVHFQGTPLMITAIAAGELDVADLAFSSFATAIVNAHMDDLKVIADEDQDGVDGYYSNTYMVLKDSPIHTIADLKGKVLSANATGSAGDISLRAMLRKNHIDDKRDVTILEVPLPNMNAMLTGHKIDLASVPLPFSADPVVQQTGRVLFTQKDAIGRTQFSFWVARGGYIAQHRAALADFMEDTLRAARWVLDPAHHKEVVESVARLTKQPAAKYDSWIFTKGDYYRDPNLMPDLDALQASTDAQQKLGFFPATVDVASHNDLSLIKEAASRLK